MTPNAKSLSSVLLAACAGSLGCSAILNSDTEQCQDSADCDFLGSDYSCIAKVCVESTSGDNCPDVEAYTFTESIAVIRDACELPSIGGRVFTNGENEAELMSPLEMPVPFETCLYGRTANNIWIGDNGYVAFGDVPPRATQADVGPAHSLGQSGLPAPGIAAFWDALLPSANGVCAAVDGAEPARTLWLTWSGFCFEDGSGACDDMSASSLTFSVGIEEGTGNFIVGYLGMTGADALADRALGQAATIGITNDGARGCLASECDSTGTCSDGTPCNYTEFAAQAVQPSLPALQFAPTP